jgi:hypothetical protein
MPTVRQLAGGLVYAVVSLLLVVGSLSLALVEGGAPPVTSTAAEIAIWILDVTPTSQAAAPPSATGVSPTSATGVPPTSAPTSEFFYPTGVPTLILTFPTPAPVLGFGPPAYWSRGCGPYPGWIRGYVVRPGDTLYRIAWAHGTTVAALERANCKTSPAIHSGELLWVPFVLAYPPP